MIDRIRTIVNNFLVVGLWLTLLVFGFTIHGRPYIDALNTHLANQEFFYFFGDLAVGAFCFTPSNMFLVSVLSCFIGAELARRTEEGEIPVEEHPNYPLLWKDALMRGFVCFFSVFFVIGWMDAQKLLNAGQEDYFKAVGMVVPVSLGAGFNPKKIPALIFRS